MQMARDLAPFLETAYGRASVYYEVRGVGQSGACGFARLFGNVVRVLDPHRNGGVSDGYQGVRETSWELRCGPLRGKPPDEGVRPGRLHKFGVMCPVGLAQRSAGPKGGK